MALTVAVVLSPSMAGCSAATSGTGAATTSAAEAPLPEPVPTPPEPETPPGAETPDPSPPTDPDSPPPAAPQPPPRSTGVPSDAPGSPSVTGRYCQVLYYDDPYELPPAPYSASTPAPAGYSPPLVLHQLGRPEQRNQITVGWPLATSTPWPVETYELAWTRAGEAFPPATDMERLQVGQKQLLVTKYAITGLQAGTEYTVRVRPRYEGADYEEGVRVSAWSPVFTVRTMDPLPRLDCTEGPLVLDPPWFTFDTDRHGRNNVVCDQTHPAFKTYRDLAPWSARDCIGIAWREPRIRRASLRVRIAGQGDVQVYPDSASGHLAVFGSSVSVGGRSCELTDLLYLTIDGSATFDTTCAE